MCGICGEYRFDRRPASLGAVERMMARLERRGPDQSGCFAEGGVALGHRRLSIIDLTWHGHQPMVDRHNGLALVFNGTIYNYRQLRETLLERGHQFFSTGDSEVILRGWQEWGEGCVERLHGMFAFAIHDAGSGELWLVRDRIGIKPLYWSAHRGAIRFASNWRPVTSTARSTRSPSTTSSPSTAWYRRRTPCSTASARSRPPPSCGSLPMASGGSVSTGD